MKIQWLGHACFLFESGGSRLILDPYEDQRVPGLGLLRAEAEAVLCSHEHRDHSAVECVTLSGRPCTLSVESLDSFHDERKGRLRGANKIHIISDGTVTLAHCGDLGHIPGKEVLEKLRGLDAVLLPVGGYYTMDAKTAHKLAQKLDCRVVIPMHYRLEGRFGYDEIGTLSAFTALRSDAVCYDRNELELTTQTPKQTAVLTYLQP